jgi:hypothetical protein
VEEDEALLRGFTAYGAQWTKIRADPELGLTSRSRTDLRDRFRNRYPHKFVEAGHKFQHKRAEDVNKEPEATASIEVVDELAPSSSRSDDINAHLLNSAAPPQYSKDGGEPQHSLKLLTSTYTNDTYFPDIAELTPSDDDDPSTITLSRNIFDWADQQSNHHSHNKITTTQVQTQTQTQTQSNKPTSGPSKTERSAEDSNTIPSKTLSRLDQFNINPMLALKVPQSSSGLQSGGLVSGATASLNLPNLFPPLPLSGILNGPVSLPPPAELVGASGLDVESGN